MSKRYVFDISDFVVLQAHDNGQGLIWGTLMSPAGNVALSNKEAMVALYQSLEKFLSHAGVQNNQSERKDITEENLWKDDDLLDMNSEFGLTMDQLYRLAVFLNKNYGKVRDE